MTPDAIDTLQLRQSSAKTSVKKYDALLRAADDDDRLRHILQFCGAQRTWRWGGRVFQPQNLPRPAFENVHAAAELIRRRDTENLALLFDEHSPLDVVSSCIRSAIRAPAGKKLVVCDYSAVENVVLGFAAQAESILQVFRDGRDPYKDYGVHLLGKPYEEITKPERTFCKPPVLGCGFMLGGPGLRRYAASMGVDMTEEEAATAKTIWRDAYPEVPSFWYGLSDAFFRAIRTGKDQEHMGVRLEMAKPLLRMHLPSGRCISYVKPRIEDREKPWIDNNTGKKATGDTIVYDGIDQYTRQWVSLTTHPGKLTENLVQGEARDLLAYGLAKADRMGFEVIGHVHDEIVALADEDGPLGLPELREAMLDLPPWAAGLPLNAEGYEDVIYRKD